MATPTQIWFDPTRIIKEGYLTKSPPLRDETLIRKRFRLRWFVLCYVGVEPTLFYFKDEKHRKQGKPKGRISLVGVEVFKQRSKVNGFPYVINIQTDDRLYHLCSTQKEVHEEWLEKLREYHIPNTEIPQHLSNASHCPCCYSLENPTHLGSVSNLLSDTKEQQLHKRQQEHQQQHPICKGLELSGGEDQFDNDPYDQPYATKRSYATNYSNTYTKQTSTPFSQHKRGPTLSSEMKSRSLDIFRKSHEPNYALEDPVIPANEYESFDSTCQGLVSSNIANKVFTLRKNIKREEKEEEDTLYVNMEQKQSDREIDGREISGATVGTIGREEGRDLSNCNILSKTQLSDEKHVITKEVTICESEDEGIGRSDSDSSGTSSITNTTATCSNQLKKLLDDAIRISTYDNDFYNRTYVGPRLLSVTKPSKGMSRSRSLGDLLES